MKVVVSGTEFSDTDVERSVLEPAGCEVEATGAISPEDIVAVAADAQALLVQYARLDADTLAKLPTLRMISRYGTGVDNIDLDAAEQHGIVVTNVPAYGGDEVALHATSLILAGVRHLPQLDRAVRSGHWHHRAAGPLRATDELTLGVLGLGRIGRVVAERAGPWFGTVVAHDLAPVDVSAQVTMVGLDELFQRSDIVSVHLPLTEDTHGIVDRARLRLLGPEGYLVNTARGALVVADDLLAVIEAGELAGAALDVLPEEPPPEDHPLLRRPEVLLTPHVAWYSTASEADLRRRAAQNVLDWRDGRPCNQVAGRGEV
jgi:D-3-phosphoglycerate dehydrogenase